MQPSAYFRICFRVPACSAPWERRTPVATFPHLLVFSWAASACCRCKVKHSFAAKYFAAACFPCKILVFPVCIGMYCISMFIFTPQYIPYTCLICIEFVFGLYSILGTYVCIGMYSSLYSCVFAVIRMYSHVLCICMYWIVLACNVTYVSILSA